MIKIPQTRPYFNDKDIGLINKDIAKILKSGRLILGPYTKKFEENFRKYIKRNHAVAVNTCTTALNICLEYFGVENKEVIVPSNTFVTDANSVIQCKGRIVFAEMDENTMCLDVGDVKKKITKKTKAIITIHMLGMIDTKIYELSELCRKKGIFLIEDCSHAHGSMIDGKKVGSFSDASCFSFYPTKVMTTGLGGMIATNDYKLQKYAQSMRFFGAGQNLDEIEHMASDWLLGEVNACIGIRQLMKLEKNVRKRNYIAKKYEKGLADIKSIRLLPVPQNIRHSYYKFAFILADSINREKIIRIMNEKYGIEMSMVYRPCHLHPLYRNKFGYKEGMFPVTEHVLMQAVCPPMFPGMNDKDINYVIDALKNELL